MNFLDLGYCIASLATAPWWMRKSRSGWAERWARVLPELPAKTPGRPRIMLHAVSVGEINALRALVPMLAKEAEVVVTVSTDTGIARARDLYAGVCHVVRFPLDASWAVRRFLDAVSPDVVGLVELELWPNFVRACSARGIPVAVINGRLSARSFKGYRRIARWISPSFASLSVAAVQDETYAGRFHAMGVSRERVAVTGSMKFDSAHIEDEVEGSAELARAMGIDRSRPLIVAGSTGPGEEALLCEACTQAFGEGEVQLLCAPRKTERFDEAARALVGCVRRTECANNSGERRVGSSLFLLDTIGELRQAYALADIVVVGRSFFDQHGSDPIEPIALGKPVILGPAVSDFAEIVRVLEEAGGLLRADRDHLAETLCTLLGDIDLQRGLADRGRECIRSLQGASDRHAELLLWLAEAGGGESGGAGVDALAGLAGVLAGQETGGISGLPSPSTRA